MLNKYKKLLKEIYEKCDYHIPYKRPEAITLDSGETIRVYRKSSTGIYVCTASKSPDYKIFKDCYTVCLNSDENRATLVPPEIKDWFADKRAGDCLGETQGKIQGEFTNEATFARFGLEPESVEVILNYQEEKPVPKQLSILDII